MKPLWTATEEEVNAAWQNRRYNALRNSIVSGDYFNKHGGGIIRHHYGCATSPFGWQVFDIDGTLHPVSNGNIQRIEGEKD